LAAVLGSFVLIGWVFAMERRGHLKKAFLGAIALIAWVQIGLLVQSSGTTSLGAMAALLFLFFCGFNALEATQPSLASRMAPSGVRGTALGVYNTLQSLGFFVGGWGGGWVVKNWGSPALFACCAVAMLVWLLLALPMQSTGRAAPVLDAA
jgi:predicted MFS family arabinose efflux permease